MTQTSKTSQGSSTGSTVLEPAPRGSGANLKKVVVGVAGIVVTIVVLLNVFFAFGARPQWFLDSKILIGILAVGLGVGGAALFFYFLNMAIEGLPDKASEALIPYAYVLPGLGLIGLMLLYPVLQTILYSFADKDSEKLVGLDNYKEIFGDSVFRQALFNNLLWIFVVPAVTVSIGVVVAVLADRLSARGEKITKSIIFLPMAISFVGASAIWTLVYDFNAGSKQTGLLNALWTAVGGEPQTWLQVSDFRLNSLLLMVILIWLQVGFAMILLSSAIKGVPGETLEAARIDGASEWQIFWKVIIPQIKGTIITVFVTVLILVLKVFDIVFVLTNGFFNTEVIANLFYKEAFANGQNGTAAAIVVVLLAAVTPVLIYQVRHFRQEDANR